MHSYVAILFRMLVFRCYGFIYQIVIFYLKFNCCAWVYILKFCRLKIVSGAVNARKWSAKWRNLNISDRIFSFSSIEGRKQLRQIETFVPCMGTMPPERALQKNGFLVLKRTRFSISDTSRSERSSGARWRTFKHINPQWFTSVYSRTSKCDELWPFQHRETFALNG